MKGLTSKQQEILDFIDEFMRRNGMAPTVYEIGDEFAIRKKTLNRFAPIGGLATDRAHRFPVSSAVGSNHGHSELHPAFSRQ